MHLLNQVTNERFWFFSICSHSCTSLCLTPFEISRALLTQKEKLTIAKYFFYWDTHQKLNIRSCLQRSEKTEIYHHDYSEHTSTTCMRAQRVLSKSLLTVRTWEECLLHIQDVMPFSETWTGWRVE